MQDIVTEAAREGKRQWGWCMTAGIALIVIGLLAVLSQTIATFATVVVLGWLVFVAGIAQIAGAFMARGVGQVILLLLVGVLDIVVGLMLVQHPVAGAVTITLLLAALLVFGGVYRFIAALWLKFPQYGMAAISGAIACILGLMLWNQWPFSAFWFLGFAVGVNFIFTGVSWASLALKLKAL